MVTVTLIAPAPKSFTASVTGKTMRSIAAGIASMMLVGCVGTPSAPPTPERIEITELDSGDWRAVFYFAEPASVARFARPAHFFRERAWRILTPGYSFARDGNSQVLALDEGAEPQYEIVVEFPVFPEGMPREYSPFLRFTDGGLAFYTAHFYAAADVAPDDFITTVVIHPQPGRFIVLNDRVHDGPVTWTDPSVRGTYAYVGNTRPVRTPHLIAIIDPGLPAWLERKAYEEIPEIMSYFAQRTGHSYARPPLVLLNYVPGGDGRRYGGSSLEGLLQFTLQGNGWEKESRDATENVFQFFAHESAHIWNGEIVKRRPDAASWMHEGAADAFAQRALLDLHIISVERYRELKELALNECNIHLDSRPLGKTQQNRNNYSCGNVLGLVTEQVLRAAGSDLDIFGFWGALITRALAGDGYFDEASYFTLLGDLGVNASTIAALKDFVNETQPLPAASIAEVLAGGDVTLVRDDTAATGEVLQEAAGGILERVLSYDCTGPYGFFTYEDRFQLARLGECRIAEEGMEIDRIGPIAATAPGFAAALYATNRCRDADTISFGLYRSNDYVEFPCPPELPAVRGFWRLVFEEGPEPASPGMR